jgi:hypothetical protein
MAAHGVDHAVVLTSHKVNVDRPSAEHVLESLDFPVEAKNHIAWQTAAELFKIDVSALG